MPCSSSSPQSVAIVMPAQYSCTTSPYVPDLPFSGLWLTLR
jgi:hypothetical protein